MQRGVAQQRLDAADMVGVAVCDQNRHELQLPRRKGIQHRRGIARIDHYGVAIVMNQPEVVVFESGYGVHIDHGWESSRCR